MATTYFSGSTTPVNVRMEVAPVTTSSTTVAAPFDHLVYTNSGTIAAQTVVLPLLPSDGDIVKISNVAAITALTLTAAVGSVLGAPSGLAAGQGMTMMWSVAQNSWFTVSS